MESTESRKFRASMLSVLPCSRAPRARLTLGSHARVSAAWEPPLLVILEYHLNILGRKTSEVSENHLESVVLSEDFGSLPQFLRRYILDLLKLWVGNKQCARYGSLPGTISK